MEVSTVSRTYRTAAPGIWGRCWEFRDLGVGWVVEHEKGWGQEGGSRLGTHLTTLIRDGAVSRKGQGICLEVTLGTLVPKGARPGQGLHVAPTLVLKNLVSWG